MHASNGILFNHESPVRGETFLTRKVTRAIARIALGLQERFFLGNLNAERDWGHAKDFVKAMYLILQQDEPDDYVIATGVKTSVRDFVRMAFEYIGVQIDFKGEGLDETGFVVSIDKDIFIDRVGESYFSKISGSVQKRSTVLEVDPRYFRPTEVDLLVGDATKARTRLGWEPEYDIKALVSDMMQSDIRFFKKDNYLRDGGFTTLNYFE